MDINKFMRLITIYQFIVNKLTVNPSFKAIKRGMIRVNMFLSLRFLLNQFVFESILFSDSNNSSHQA